MREKENDISARGSGTDRDTVPKDKLDDEVQAAAARALLEGSQDHNKGMKPTLDR